MYTYNKINIREFLNLDNKEITEIMNFINEENKSYNSPIITAKDLVNRFKKRKDIYSYIFILKNNNIVGGFRYYKTTIKDKILLRRFIYKNGTYYCIQAVFVLPKYRKQGICSQLINYFFESINKKYDSLSFRTILAVDKKNIPAIKCYTKNGFKKVIERKVTNKLLDTNNYTEYFSEYLMIKV